MSRFTAFASAALIAASLAPIAANAQSYRQATSVASYNQQSNQNIPAFQTNAGNHRMPVADRQVGGPISDSTAG
ncbi:MULTISPECIES: hypothetical protein [unclassified Acidocella]|uniref:hypothetical protein n=1 Tax=unclassified Acidocella TaxID=2648610 RepID=UPI00028D4705|nr:MULTISPECIES: hypothetical protein [unclassified Acidocella]EKM98763.1 hypothetical protein MXAZACID_13813 [Acidocella sp. MX-AZ02]WBO58789.1 hypothetical protein GT370_16930 [Acidocella sp. MX-AZ03]